jgi:hypothetical protein
LESRFKKGLEKDLEKEWTPEMVTPDFNKKMEAFLFYYRKTYQDAYNKAVSQREKLIFQLENRKDEPFMVNEAKNRYFNESLSDLVRNINEKDRILEYNGELIQQVNPIFVSPRPKNALDYRTHFFAPEKNLFGAAIPTFTFNLLVIWVMSVILYVALYFELLRKFVNLFDGTSSKSKSKESEKAKIK